MLTEWLGETMVNGELEIIVCFVVLSIYIGKLENLGTFQTAQNLVKIL
jgi:hypothetical protein